MQGAHWRWAAAHLAISSPRGFRASHHIPIRRDETVASTLTFALIARRLPAGT